MYIGIQPFRTFRNLKGHLDQCFQTSRCNRMTCLQKKKKKKGPGPLLDFLVEVGIASLLITSSQGTNQIWLHWSQASSRAHPTLDLSWLSGGHCAELSPGRQLTSTQVGEESRSPPFLGLDVSSSDTAALCLHLPQRNFCRHLVFQRQAQGCKSENFKLSYFSAIEHPQILDDWG